MFNRLSGFKSDERGVAAMLFALVGVVILMVVGVAIDVQRGMSADKRLQSSLDAAALAGAKALENASTTDAQIITAARAAFAANIAAGHTDVTCSTPNVAINRTSGRVTVDADCSLPTTMANLVKIDKMDMTDIATARASITQLDVAFMLDVSGSMNGSKLADLKTATNNAIDTLITPSSGDRVRVAFNTYSTSVNAGDYADKVLDISLPGAKKKNCVSERKGAWAWKDEAPGLNKWLGNKAKSCPKSSVEPLSSNAAMLKAEINKLKASGNTAGHLGVAWAWYLISPEWDTVWPTASKPLAYDAQNSKKAVILMTDGVFNTAYEAGQGNSAQQARKLCKRMRDENIIVYAVAFEAPFSAKKTLQDCAGDPERFFDASDGEELKKAYAAIASQLANLALTD
ncbi:VWA domain-containing protein [Henriciella sp. AS95]|uniref:VWA domain-containing protein n=1 Tax=Henriciella sp. AS95 TaxID=3135782 RepID=UPI00317B654A